MGTWAEDFLSSNATYKLIDNVVTAILFNSHTRKAYLRVCQTAQLDLNRISSDNFIAFIDKFTLLDKELSQDRFLNTYKLSNPQNNKISWKPFHTALIQSGDLKYNFQSVFRHNHGIEIVKPFTVEETQHILEVAIAASFEPTDYQAIVQETLTPNGIIKNPEIMNSLFSPLDGEEFEYKKADTYDAALSFYNLSTIMANLPCTTSGEIFTPYLLKQFLNASHEYFSTSHLSTCADIPDRFNALSEDLQKVIEKLAVNPKNQEIFLAHYRHVVQYDERPTDLREFSAPNFRGERKKIPSETKAFSSPFIKALLEKDMLAQSIKLDHKKELALRAFKI